MIAQLHIPASPLCHFIESFFYYRDSTERLQLHRFLPDGHVTLVLDLTDRPKHIYANDSLEEIQTCRRAWFSGFRTEPITIPSGVLSEMMIVNFRRGMALPFLDRPLHEVTDYVVDAEILLRDGILELRERLLEAPSIPAKFERLEHHLLRHYRSRLEVNPFVDYAIRQIIARPSAISLQEMAQKVGFSQKHIIKLFKDHVGVTPKNFLKVIRFQQIVEAIEQRQVVQWTEIAHDCGFYDQSHFIADFKRYAGYTPEAYLRKKGQLLNYVPIG